MYLVEFIHIYKKSEEHQCTGFYSEDDALSYALKLNICANVKSVTVSKIDTSYVEVIKEFQHD